MINLETKSLATNKPGYHHGGTDKDSTIKRKPPPYTPVGIVVI
ncbi:hypothetical protein [Desulforamulus reducens]|nr:hypothetical protein [Desulforamulus reducens]